MGLADLFRPKWKHSDVEVRAAAVRELELDTHGEILETIARDDGDAEVRRIAIKKLQDPRLLLELAASDADEALRRLAGERGTSLLISTAVSSDEPQAAAGLALIKDERALGDVARGAALETLRRAALERIQDPRILTEVARGAKDPEVRLAAVRRIEDEAVLRGVALDEENREVAMAALERLSAPDALEAISRRGKCKAVRVLARKRLGEARARGRASASLEEAGEPAREGDEAAGARAEGERAQVSEAQRRSRQEQMCRTIEALARSADFERVGPQLEEARREWRELGTDAPEELRSRFDGAFAAFEERRAKIEERRTKIEERRSALTQRAQSLETTLGARLALVREAESLESDGGLARLAEVEAAWERLGPLADIHAEAGRSFERARAEVRRRIESQGAQRTLLTELAELARRAEALRGSSRPRQALKQLQIHEEEWRRRAGSLGEVPGAKELEASLASVRADLEGREVEEKAERELRKKENLARLTSLCDNLEKLVQSTDWRAAERSVREVQAQIRKPGPLPGPSDEEELRTRFHAIRERVLEGVREQKEADDWRRWAAIPKLEELCARVEALVKGPDPRETTRKLREAQAEWRKVGPVPKERSEVLWARFKKACDQVYESCQDYFSKLEEERTENLKKKEELCARIEAFADSIDWAKTADEIKKIQGEWRAIGPVPHAQSDAIWRRFRAGCDHFFDKRQEHLDRTSGERLVNLQKKEELCARVEALADSTDWVKTADEIKRIQAEWRMVGPVPRAQSDAVWKRFRAACDHFFGRRQAEVEQEKVGHQRRKEEIIARVEALIPRAAEPDVAAAPESVPAASPAEDVARAVLEAQAEWRASGPAPAAISEEIWERFSRACEAVVRAFPEPFRGTDLDPTINLRKREKLCHRAEALAGPEPEAAPPAVSGEAAGRAVERMAEQLRSALAANAFSEGERDPRAEAASVVEEIRQLQQAWRRLGPAPHEEGAALWERFRTACERVLARHEVPEVVQTPGEDPREAASFEKKSALLEKVEKLTAQPQTPELREEVKRIQRQWKGIGPVPKEKAKTLWNRFRKACNRLLSEGARPEQRDAEEDTGATAATPAELDGGPAPGPDVESAEEAERLPRSAALEREEDASSDGAPAGES
jgi:hypothetical protein